MVCKGSVIEVTSCLSSFARGRAWPKFLPNSYAGQGEAEDSHRYNGEDLLHRYLPLLTELERVGPGA